MRLEDVASKAGCSYATIARLESGGGGRNPTLRTARAIAEVLGTTVEDLFPPAENAA